MNAQGEGGTHPKQSMRMLRWKLQPFGEDEEDVWEWEWNGSRSVVNLEVVLALKDDYLETQKYLEKYMMMVDLMMVARSRTLCRGRSMQ